MQRGAEGDLRDIAAGNLDVWKRSGVIGSLRCYSAEDAEVCAPCRRHHGLIVRVDEGAIGKNLPPLDACVNGRCRCYFRPWDVLLQ